jgi:hypothetical protein
LLISIGHGGARQSGLVDRLRVALNLGQGDMPGD